MYFKEEGPGFCTQLARLFLIVVNVCMGLGALAFVGIGAYIEATSDQSVIEFCKTCSNATIFAISLFGTLFIFCLIGVVALWKRNGLLLCVYGFYLVVFALGALAITIVFVMAHEGKLDSLIEDTWKSTISSDSKAGCDIQRDLKCSGWNVLCNDTEAYNNVSAGVNDTNPNVFCPYCLDQPVVANFTETCRSAFDREIDRYFEPAIIIGFTLVGLSAFSVLVAYKVRKSDDEGPSGGKYEYTRV
jgi:hypothetical protein